MTYLRWMSVALSTVALSMATGCGSDDDDGDGTGGGSTGGTDTGGSGGADTGGSGGTATGGSGGTATGGGGSGSGSDADAFCADYETTCTFGGTGRFADMADCTSAFDGYDAARQDCVTTHVGLAGSDPDVHCPHATGEAPCN